MTKISYIAGVGSESAPRGSGIKPQPFIPYLSMTKGEMHLALMLEQAQILAGFYGTPKYTEAAQMLENTLYRGVHGASVYLGAYNPELQPLARIIAKASRQTRPASNAAFHRPSGIGKGIHIGEPIIDYDARGKECLKWANSANSNAEKKRRKRECERIWRVEKIINDGVENCGQYVAYGWLPRNNGLPALALYKVQDQLKAQQDISRVGKFDMSLTQQWLNIGMMRRNADTAKIQPYGWTNTNAILMMLPEAGQQEVIALLNTLIINNKKLNWAVGGNTEAQVGAQLAAIIQKYAQSGVGEPVSATLAIVGAITVLIKAISEFAKALKIEEQDAFSQVNGFGTRAFGPEDGDWQGPPPPPGTGSDYTTLFLAGGAVALWAITRK